MGIFQSINYDNSRAKSISFASLKLISLENVNYRHYYTKATAQPYVT